MSRFDALPDMIQSENVKKFMTDTFVRIVGEKMGLDLSGVANATNLLAFLSTLNGLYWQFEKHSTGRSTPSEIDRLKVELNSFCGEYAHVLPPEWIELSVELQQSDAKLQVFYLSMLTWSGGLGQALWVVKGIMYANQSHEVCRTKHDIEQLIRAGYDYAHLSSLNQKVATLQQRVNRLEELIRRYRFEADNCEERLCDEIRKELEQANHREYTQIMTIIEMIKNKLNTESKELEERKKNVNTAQTLSWIGTAVGVGLTIFSLMDKKSGDNSKNNQSEQSEPSSSRVNPKVGMSVAAASIAALGISSNEKSKLTKMEQLVKDRCEKLTSIDAQLKDVKNKLDAYANWVNNNDKRSF